MKSFKFSWKFFFVMLIFGKKRSVIKLFNETTKLKMKCENNTSFSEPGEWHLINFMKCNQGGGCMGENPPFVKNWLKKKKIFKIELGFSQRGVSPPPLTLQNFLLRCDQRCIKGVILESKHHPWWKFPLINWDILRENPKTFPFFTSPPPPNFVFHRNSKAFPSKNFWLFLAATHKSSK